MSAADPIDARNHDLARRINQEARTNPQSPYANKFVGIANGQVVAVADDLDEMTRLLRQAEGDPRRCFWVEASRDYDEVHHIWELSNNQVKGPPYNSTVRAMARWHRVGRQPDESFRAAAYARITSQYVLYY